MSVINKTIQSNKTYTYTLDSIPDVTTDDWYIKKVNSSNINFKFGIRENRRSFSLTCTNGKETTYSNVEISITIGFRNTTGPTRTDKTISTIWNIKVTAPRLPFIIKNTKAGQDITFSITKNGSVALDYNYYIGDISDTMPDTSLYTNQTETKTFDIPNGKALYLYSDTMTALGDYNSYTQFNSNFDFDIAGSLMGMLKHGTRPYFRKLFSGCTGLTSIPENLLPSTEITYSSYERMFQGCTGLTSIPENLLPATYLYNGCYDGMFVGCTGLTSIPENLLPATEIGPNCYKSMFSGCTGLTSIPENLLPATNLKCNCYMSMFSGCTGLTSIPENLLPATEIEQSCYGSMFWGCTGLTSIPENLLPATHLVYNYCYEGMFGECTGLTSIPENLLPATTLTSRCYCEMFRKCSGLTKGPNLPATKLTDDCYKYMFDECTKLNYIKVMTLDPLGNNTGGWLSSVSATGTAVVNANATWVSEMTRNGSTIPEGWTIVTATD